MAGNPAGFRNRGQLANVIAVVLNEKGQRAESRAFDAGESRVDCRVEIIGRECVELRGQRG